MKKFALLTVFILTFPFYLFAQKADSKTLPDLNSDRPDRGQGPAVIPRGTLQMETGFEFQKDRGATFESKEYIYPNLLLRAGVLSWAELRINLDYKKSRESIFPDTPREATDEDKGFNDVQIATKINLYPGKGFIPQIGVLGRITFPVGDKDFRPPYIAPGGSLLFSHELSKKVELQYNIGYGKQGNQDEYRGQTEYAINTSLALNNRLKGYVELFGQKPHQNIAEHHFDTGFLYLLWPNFQIDVIGGLGLNEAAPSFFAGGGFTLRIPR